MKEVDSITRTWYLCFILTRSKKMIRSAKQDWSIGNTVKVGFLTLKVTGRKQIQGIDQLGYTLESLDGSRKYDFAPHNGLARIN